MTSIERTAYLRFKRFISARELREAFTPIVDEGPGRVGCPGPQSICWADGVLLKSFQRGWTSAPSGPAPRTTRRCPQPPRRRLSVRTASSVIAGIAEAAALDDPASVHTLRHTCATILVRGGTDLVTVAAILGHARRETTRTYGKPTEEDHLKALGLLPVDR